MCWFNRVRFTCGGEIWGDRQRQCSKSLQSEASGSGDFCTTRRFTRRINNSSECPFCGGEDPKRQQGKHGLNWASAHQKPFRNLFAQSELHSPLNSYEDLKNTRWQLLCITPNPRDRAKLEEFFSPILRMRYSSEPNHENGHEVQCPNPDCYFAPGHDGPHGLLPRLRWCDVPGCAKEFGHDGSHYFGVSKSHVTRARDDTTRSIVSGPIDGPETCRFDVLKSLSKCKLSDVDIQLYHRKTKKFLAGVFQIPEDRNSAHRNSAVAQLEDIDDQNNLNLHALDSKVLEAMGGELQSSGDQNLADVQLKLRREQMNAKAIKGTGRSPFVSRMAKSETREIGQSPKTKSFPYEPLEFGLRQIRLFKLEPSTDGSISGSFVTTELESCPDYTALSYTWGGGQNNFGTIRITNTTKQLNIGENLWHFLQTQCQYLTATKYFWIDAICIDQQDVHERNHQVGLMKLIYTTATNVYSWLGPSADDSDLAMTFLSSSRAARTPRRRGLAFAPVWTRREGAALRELCEREYWRRMWIIQEVIHANKITVWCGSLSFDWASAFDRLYATLGTIDNNHWLSHQPFGDAVFHSSAFTMVWQRAYWRHPETPLPTLRRLLEVFRHWKCSDPRDHVYALVGMATKKTAVEPDYSRSASELYNDVLLVNPCDGFGDDCDKYDEFSQLLSELVGLRSLTLGELYQ